MINNRNYQFFEKNELLVIIMLALIIRVGFFISLQPWVNEVVNKSIIVSDASSYHKLALSLMDKKSFEVFDAYQDRTPGYPVFVALLYSISSKSVGFVLLIQIFLNVISVLFVFKIASIIFSSNIAILSAFLFAIDAIQALNAVMLFTDTLFVFWFLVSVYYFCKSVKEKTIPAICLSALFLGMATLVRPISFLFPFIMTAFILAFCNLKLKMKLVYVLLYCTIFFVSISPWLLHNYSKYGKTELTSLPGYALLFYNVAYTEVYKTSKTIGQVRQDFYDLADKRGAKETGGNQFKNSQIYSEIAQQYIKDNFILYCKIHFMGIVNMYAGIGTPSILEIFHLDTKPFKIAQSGGPGTFPRLINFFQSISTIEIFLVFGLVFYLLINYSFSLYGIFISIKKRKTFVFLFILIALYFSVITGVIGQSRYRLPFMPFINILCAVGLYHFYDKVKDKNYLKMLHRQI